MQALSLALVLVAIVPAIARAAPSSACDRPDVPDTVDTAAIATDRVDGCFEPGGKRDLYAVDVTGTGAQLVSVVLRADRPSPSAFVVALDHRGQPISSAAMAQPGTESTLDILARGGTRVHLRVYGNVEPARPTPYTLLVSQRPNTDPGEPNDDRASASPLPVGPPLATALTPDLDARGQAQDDVDHYRVQVDRRGTLRVAVEPSGFAAELSVLTAAGRRRGGARSAPDQAATAEVAVTPGAYLVVVRRAHTRVYFQPSFVDRRGDIGDRYRITATLR